MLCLLLLVSLAHATPQDDAKIACDSSELPFTMTSQSGTVETPEDFMGRYEADLFCEWRIYTETPAGYSVHLDFTSFETYVYDVMHIVKSDNSELVDSFSGTHEPFTVDTKTNNVTIMFLTDYAIQSTGIKLNYEVRFLDTTTTEEPTTTPQLTTDPPTTTSTQTTTTTTTTTTAPQTTTEITTPATTETSTTQSTTAATTTTDSTTSGPSTTPNPDKGYDCSAELNPCTKDNIDSGLFYFPHHDPTKFVQCTQVVGECFVVPCPDGMVWVQEILSCEIPLQHH